MIVVGGGFTGLEIATEMPQRLHKIFGTNQSIRVVLVDSSATIGASIGPEDASVIQEALK